ncbi:Phenylacetate-coenzyme A ligase, partial [hydrothermal vent metagenome]
LAGMLESMGSSDVSIFGTYGFTESRCAWGECPTSNDLSSGYHLYPDKEIFEIVDPDTGEVKKEGEDGEIVYTSLDGRASSVLRYRTGDFVKGGITYEPCPHCHRSLPRLNSDITRLSNIKDLQLSKVKGSLVNFNNFSLAMAEVDLVDEWQIELKKKNDDPFEIDELNVYVSIEKECNKEVLEKEIGKQLLFATEVTPNEVIIVSREDMVDRLEIETANKEKRIIDNRPKD